MPSILAYKEVNGPRREFADNTLFFVADHADVAGFHEVEEGMLWNDERAAHYPREQRAVDLDPLASKLGGAVG